MSKVINQDSIQKEAKQIMDNFMKALDKIEIEQDFILERDNCFREEGNGKEVDEDFRQRFLSNAPKISGDAILANKGEWVE